MHQIEVSGIPVDIVRKDIKNLHLAVYPPSGRVRVATPLMLDDEAVRLAVISRLPWIRKQQTSFDGQRRQPPREMITGESHYFQGKKYRLKVFEHQGPTHVVIRQNGWMDMYVRPGTTLEKRTEILHEWYRVNLKERIPDIIIKWEPIIGVLVADWRVKKMKTKWGSCNREARRLWLNLELAKKHIQCLEYIIVHEMVHLHERHHNDNFRKLMNRYMPQWQFQRDVLNREPLAHEDWTY